MPAWPYHLRKAFALPLVVGTFVWSFAMCYDWWLADTVQFLLLSINFLLFILSAYLLQTLPALQPPEIPHRFKIFMHQCIGLALLFVNRSRAIGLGDLFDGLESKIPPRSDAEDVVEFSYLVLRIMALFWSTSVTFLTCVVLSSRTDFLAEGESNDIYFNLIGLMTWTGFAWFVQIVKPNTLSDPLPLHSYPMDDPFANSRQEDALQEDP